MKRLKNAPKNSDYYIDVRQGHYSIIGPQGFIVSFNNLNEAIMAIRDFSTKSFPKSWAKVSPGMQAAIKKYHGIHKDKAS